MQVGAILFRARWWLVAASLSMAAAGQHDRIAAGLNDPANGGGISPAEPRAGAPGGFYSGLRSLPDGRTLTANTPRAPARFGVAGAYDVAAGDRTAAASAAPRPAQPTFVRRTTIPPLHRPPADSPAPRAVPRHERDTTPVARRAARHAPPPGVARPDLPQTLVEGEFSVGQG
jgi:hypothetical protein